MKLNRNAVPDWLKLKSPELYKTMVEDFDVLNRNAEKGDPWTPKKRVAIDEIVDFLFKRAEASLAEITQAVYGIETNDLAWAAAKRNINSRLESKNIAKLVQGIFERVEGKKATWRLTAAKRAAVEKQVAALETLEKKVEVSTVKTVAAK